MDSNSDESEAVRRLFEATVPDIASGIVQIVGIVRDPGYRSIIAVRSNNPAVDPVGACVGNRGERVKRVVADLGGEYVDIVRWSDSPERFIGNMLAPLHFLRVSLDESSREATVLLARDSERPVPKRLAVQSQLLLKLTGWHLKLTVSGED